MIAQLPPVVRRVLAVVLLLMVIAIVLRGLIVPTWRMYLDNRDAIAQMEDTIARYARLSAQVESLRQTVAELEEAGELGQYLLDEASEPLAAAALQERLKAMVTSSGGTLISTQVLPTESDEGLKRVIVSVRMAGSVAALQGVLYELESSLPFLLTDNLVVLSRNARQRNRMPSSDDSLDIRFNLHGFLPSAEKRA